MNKQVIFINSHPIQYFAPLYKYLNLNGLKTSAWYCSDKSIKGSLDKEFGVNVKWDIPLLEGYEYTFYRNFSYKPSHESGFLGLINLGMILKLFQIPKSLIIVHGWHYFTHMLIILLAGFRGHTVCLRYEMPYNQELLKIGWKQNIKRWFLKNAIFPRLNYFLYIGIQNRLLYKNTYNITDDRLVFCPYSVDNARFISEYNHLKCRRHQIKDKLGIPLQDKVILFSGKYIDKKRPLDIVNAFNELSAADCWLILLGEGELRVEIEKLIEQKNIKKVILTGFVNQSQVSEYYAISDVFVMCSTVGETWGLSVNEALNFNLPVVVSDFTGCAYDLVDNDVNGYIFKTSDIEDLASKIELVLDNREKFRNDNAFIKLQKFSYQSIGDNLKALV